MWFVIAGALGNLLSVMARIQRARESKVLLDRCFCSYRIPRLIFPRWQIFSLNSGDFSRFLGLLTSLAVVKYLRLLWA